MINHTLKKALLLFPVFFFTASTMMFAQDSPLSSTSKNNLARLFVGEQVPSTIWETLPRKKTTQLIILDFWSTSCASCIEAFPKMDQLQKEFDDRLQIILVNSWETDANIKDRFANMNKGRTKNSLEPIILPALPALTGDTIYKSLFPAVTIPHHVWLDGTGKVLAITSGYNATSEHVQAILNGQRLNMLIKDDFLGQKVAEKGYLQPTSPDMPPVYYSAFIPFFDTGLNSSNRIDSVSKTFRVTYYNEGVIPLFKTAFRAEKSKARQRVVLDLKHKDLYQYPENNHNLIDDYMRNRTFTYEIQGPLKNRTRWRDRMKQDVNAFFGDMFGIKGGMEKRSYKCWILVKAKDGLLRTSGKESDEKAKEGFRSWTNQPIEYVISELSLLEDLERGLGFVNETGLDLSLPVDVELNGDLKDIQNLKKQLKRYGLDIVEGIRELEVLVIKDIR